MREALKNPESPETAAKVSWTTFLLAGLVLAAIVLSFLNWYKTHDQGTVRQEIVELQANIQAELKHQEGSMAAA